VVPNAVAPFERTIPTGAPHGGARRRSRDADPGDVDFVDRVEGVRRVADEELTEPGGQPGTGDDGGAAGARRLVELDQGADRVVVVAAGHERGAAVDRVPCHQRLEPSRYRGRDDVDAVRDRRTGLIRDWFRTITQRAGQAFSVVTVSRRDEDAIETGSVDELARRPDADGARPHEEDAGHRKSGPSSSRQPPLVVGTPPFPRSLTTPPTSTAINATSRPRRNAFTGGV
jgi:hypothetical protein